MRNSARSNRRNAHQSRARRMMVAPDEDPLNGVANLFDVAMVFAVALLLSMVVAMDVPELLFSNDDVTVLKNPGKPDMEIIKKNGNKVERYKMSEQAGTGEGERLGICYRLANGEVIYVPEGAVPPAQ